jgi:TRAP-type uncharacterized transport system fused permease subunit
VFVFNPSLMMQGGHGIGETLATVLTSLVGLIAVAAGVQGYLMKAATAMERVILVVSGLGIVSSFYYPVLGILGSVLLALTFLRQGGYHYLARMTRKLTKQSVPHEEEAG